MVVHLIGVLEVRQAVCRLRWWAGFGNFFNGRVGLLDDVLPQGREREEVALVAEPPADVPLYPLLALPLGMPSEN